MIEGKHVRYLKGMLIFLMDKTKLRGLRQGTGKNIPSIMATSCIKMWRGEDNGVNEQVPIKVREKM